MDRDADHDNAVPSRMSFAARRSSSLAHLKRQWNEPDLFLSINTRSLDEDDG